METRLYIGGVKVDLFDEEPIIIDKELSDIMSPATRKVSHSRTIIVPSTANNDNIFQQIFVLNKDNEYIGFDANIRAVAFIQTGSTNSLEGYIQLVKISNLNGSRRYELVMYSDEKSIFSQMGDLFISGNVDSSNDVDLDSDANNYVLSESVIDKTDVDAFIGSSNICQPIYIDAGQNEEVLTSAGSFYRIKFESQRLVVKFKHIWDRIFSKYNQTYSSAFINSDRFLRHVYIDTHARLPKLNQSEVNQISCTVNRETPSAYSTTSPNWVSLDNKIQDAGSLYNLSTNKFTSTSKRYYAISHTVQLRTAIEFSIGRALSSTFVWGVNLSCDMIVNGVSILTSSKSCDYTVSGTQPPGTIFINDVVDGSTVKTFQFSQLILLDVGDTVEFQYGTTFTSTDGTAGVLKSVSVVDGDILQILPQFNEITTGDTYYPSKAIASQHKQKDFIIDCLKMFNLYVLYDGVNYIIEPRDAFYQLGQQRDWTQLVDRSSEFDIVPVGQVNWKRLEFKFAIDKDYYSDLYSKSNSGDSYGQLNLINSNEFVTDKKEVQLVFAPPISVSAQPYYPKLQHTYTFSGSTKNGIDGMPRFGYYVGWKEETTTYFELYDLAANSSVVWGYPYVGEFNDPVSATDSVLFAPPKLVFFKTFAPFGIPADGQYAYYENEIISQISKNAKVINAYINLSPYEVNSLKLYDRIVIDGTEFLISKLIGYNATQQQPTQVELIQYVK